MNSQKNEFATVLNCMDGRVQRSVNEVVRDLFQVHYVDTITEAGIVKFLSEETQSAQTEATLASIRISLECHGSRAIAVAAHHNCAGNPREEGDQKAQLQAAVRFLSKRFENCRIAAVWVGDTWNASVLENLPAMEATKT
jgi:hypothetical protein